MTAYLLTNLQKFFRHLRNTTQNEGVSNLTHPRLFYICPLNTENRMGFCKNKSGLSFNYLQDNLI